MSRGRHILHRLKNSNEVRHLLLDVTAGAGAAKLSKLINAVETALDTGTQYNMEQKAIAVAKDWIANEGFKLAGENEHVFESLENTIALVTYLGFKHVQDRRYENLHPGRGRINVGICPLDRWPGVKPDYQYAFNGLTIILATPRVPPVVANTPQEIIAAVKERDAIGPTVEFILGGDE
jgi:hypothetical protein